MGRLNLTAETEAQKNVLAYLEENASEALTEKINNGTTTPAGVVVRKTMAGCWNYIRDEARKKARNQVAVIEDAEVYGWAVHYFEEDDIKETTKSTFPISDRSRRDDDRSTAAAAEQREKEVAARKAEEERKKAEKEEAERRKIEKAEEERRQKRIRAAERAEAAAAKAKEREEKATGAVAGQLSLFDLFGGEG